MEKEIKGYKIPVCQALVKTPTILGISRDAFFINAGAATVFILSLRVYWMIIFFIITHILLGIICNKDPQIIEIFLKHYVKQKNYYYED